MQRMQAVWHGYVGRGPHHVSKLVGALCEIIHQVDLQVGT